MPRFQEGFVVWLTGLSGSGKSTLAGALRARLAAEGGLAVVLDGDEVRRGLNSDLGFSPADRSENIRRVTEVAALLARSGAVAIVALVSPAARDRALAKSIAVKAGRHCYEIHLAASLEVCEARDAKGLYRRARAGEIPEFTGVSAPYEAPRHPDLALRTGETSVEECLTALLSFLTRVEPLQAP